MFRLQLSGSHIYGWLAGSDGLFCSEIPFGFGIVPRPPVLSESVEFPQCHSSSFFFCNQDCLPRSFCKQLFITRVKTTAVRNYPVHHKAQPTNQFCLISLILAISSIRRNRNSGYHFSFYQQQYMNC